MIYRLYNGGMDPVARVTPLMVARLCEAEIDPVTKGYYFRIGHKHYWSDKPFTKPKENRNG